MRKKFVIIFKTDDNYKIVFDTFISAMYRQKISFWEQKGRKITAWTLATTLLIAYMFANKSGLFSDIHSYILFTVGAWIFFGFIVYIMLPVCIFNKTHTDTLEQIEDERVLEICRAAKEKNKKNTKILDALFVLLPVALAISLVMWLPFFWFHSMVGYFFVYAVIFAFKIRPYTRSIIMENIIKHYEIHITDSAS